MTAPTTPSTTSAAPAVTAPSKPFAESSRSEQFRAELAEMRIREPRASWDGVFMKGGLLLLVAGIVVAIIGYFTSHSTNNALQQRDAVLIGMLGLTISVAGAAIYLRYGLASFMRFWLARFLFEQRSTQDRADH